jgi:hypothetical protein
LFLLSVNKKQRMLVPVAATKQESQKPKLDLSQTVLNLQEKLARNSSQSQQPATPSAAPSAAPSATPSAAPSATPSATPSSEEAAASEPGAKLVWLYV